MSQYDALFDRGFAVGQTDIVNETMFFRFRDETFTFPTFQVYHYLDNSLYGFYVIPIDKLRELEREAAH